MPCASFHVIIRTYVSQRNAQEYKCWFVWCYIQFPVELTPSFAKCLAILSPRTARFPPSHHSPVHHVVVPARAAWSLQSLCPLLTSSADQLCMCSVFFREVLVRL